jgi:hypothetical protein
MLTDVERIIVSHAQLNHKGLGRRGLGHITRSGILMLCAAWELYDVDNMLTEFLCSNTPGVERPWRLVYNL